MSLRTSTVLVLVALGASACKPPPPPPPPAPTADPAPPPPPKCEAMSEKCEAKPDTRAKIPNSDLAFTPAAGWIYAQQSSATLAQAADGGAGIAFLGFDYDAKDAKKEVSTKDATFAELCKQLGLNPVKKKISWKSPEDKKKLGNVEVHLWQLESAGVRGPKKGPLLVVAAHADGGKAVIGVGFVPDDDKSSADAAIMKSVESLGKAQ